MIQGQLNLFDREKYKIKNKIRLIELFAGIGSQAKALTNLKANFEHWKVCEFDKYAVTSYKAVHNTEFKPSDITKLKGEDLQIEETDKYTYIMTYSFPCQDLSLAGKQQGMGVGTRSGLLWEVERLLKEIKHLPQVLLMENVPQVKGTKNIEHFRKWLDFLSSLGYSNKYECLNAKNYGIPQNRDRCFMVSILGDYSYEFPQGKPLKLRLKDMLEIEVDEKYYLNNLQVNSRLNSTFAQYSKIEPNDGICSTLCAIDYKDPKITVVANLNIPGRHESACRVYSTDGIAPTCNTCGGGGLETKILEPIILDDTYGFEESPRIYTDCPTIRAERQGLKVVEPLAYGEQNNYMRLDGTVGTLTTDGSSPKHNNRVVEPNYRFYNQALEILKENKCEFGDTVNAFNKTVNKSGLSPTITTRPEGFKTAILPIDINYRIRKLTPLECWRLMGFDDEDFDKAKATGMSNSQLYKQAGNSIVVNVLEEIFKEML